MKSQVGFRLRLMRDVYHEHDCLACNITLDPQVLRNLL